MFDADASPLFPLADENVRVHVGKTGKQLSFGSHEHSIGIEVIDVSSKRIPNNVNQAARTTARQ